MCFTSITKGQNKISRLESKKTFFHQRLFMRNIIVFSPFIGKKGQIWNKFENIEPRYERAKLPVRNQRWLAPGNSSQEQITIREWRNDPLDNDPTGCLQPTGLLYLLFWLKENRNGWKSAIPNGPFVIFAWWNNCNIASILFDSSTTNFYYDNTL